MPFFGEKATFLTNQMLLSVIFIGASAIIPLFFIEIAVIVVEIFAVKHAVNRKHNILKGIV